MISGTCMPTTTVAESTALMNSSAQNCPISLDVGRRKTVGELTRGKP